MFHYFLNEICSTFDNKCFPATSTYIPLSSTRNMNRKLSAISSINVLKYSSVPIRNVCSDYFAAYCYKSTNIIVVSFSIFLYCSTLKTWIPSISGARGNLWEANSLNTALCTHAGPPWNSFFSSSPPTQKVLIHIRHFHWHCVARTLSCIRQIELKHVRNFRLLKLVLSLRLTTATWSQQRTKSSYNSISALPQRTQLYHTGTMINY